MTVAAGVLVPAPSAFAGGLLGSDGALSTTVAQVATTAQPATQAPPAPAQTALPVTQVVQAAAPVVEGAMQAVQTTAAQATTSVPAVGAVAGSVVQAAAAAPLAPAVVSSGQALSTATPLKTHRSITDRSSTTRSAPVSAAGAAPSAPASAVPAATVAAASHLSVHPAATHTVYVHRVHHAAHRTIVTPARAHTAAPITGDVTPVHALVVPRAAPHAVRGAWTSSKPVGRLTPQTPANDLLGWATRAGLGLAAAGGSSYTILFLVLAASLLLAVSLRMGPVRAPNEAVRRMALVSPLERPG